MIYEYIPAHFTVLFNFHRLFFLWPLNYYHSPPLEMLRHLYRYRVWWHLCSVDFVDHYAVIYWCVNLLVVKGKTK
jgi:hypothetical protein